MSGGQPGFVMQQPPTTAPPATAKPFTLSVGASFTPGAGFKPREKKPLIIKNKDGEIMNEKEEYKAVVPPPKEESEEEVSLRFGSSL